MFKKKKFSELSPEDCADIIEKAAYGCEELGGTVRRINLMNIFLKDLDLNILRQIATGIQDAPEGSQVKRFWERK